jgi:hypothetical protein
MNSLIFDFAKNRNFSWDLDLGFFQFQDKPKKQRFCILFFQFSLEKEAKK